MQRPLNRDAILFHLRQAQEKLDRIIWEIVNDPSYEEGEFRDAMGPIYHHLNTSWNGRDASAEDHDEPSQRDYDAWRRFPKDADLLLK
jgi:hypothetical protein